MEDTTQNNLFNPNKYKENSPKNCDIILKRLKLDLKILGFDDFDAITISALAIYKRLTFVEIKDFYPEKIHQKTFSALMSNSDYSLICKITSEKKGEFIKNVYSFEKTSSFFNQVFETRTQKKIKQISENLYDLLENVLSDDTEKNKLKYTIRKSGADVTQQLLYRRIVAALVNLDFPINDAKILTKLYISDDDSLLTLSEKSELKINGDAISIHNWISYDLDKSGQGVYRLKEPLYDLLLNSITDWIDTILNTTKELKIIFEFLEKPSIHFSLIEDDIKGDYTMPYLTGKFSSAALSSDILKENLTTTVGMNHVEHYIQHSLKFLGYDYADAHVISKFLVNKNVSKNDLYTTHSEKQNVSVSLEKFIKQGIIEHVELNYSEHYKLIPAPTNFINTIISKIETEDIAYKNKIDTEVKILIDKYCKNANQRYIKTQYLPEYTELLEYYKEYFSNPNIPKILLALAILPNSKLEVVKLDVGVDRDFKLKPYLYRLKQSGYLSSNGDRFELGLPLYSILLDLFNIRENKRKDVLEILHTLSEKLEKVHAKKHEKNKLSELQANFLLSFGNSLVSFNKITDEIFEIKLKKNASIIRTCLVALTPENRTTLHAHFLSKKPVANHSKNIILFGYVKDFNQYVVWSFAENYDVMVARNLSIPKTIFDDVIGNREVMLHTIHSNASVLTCPADQTANAVRYWLEKKAEMDDQWFI